MTLSLSSGERCTKKIARAPQRLREVLVPTELLLRFLRPVELAMFQRSVFDVVAADMLVPNKMGRLTSVSSR